ncbi:uroporphyrinogen-III C-methyltransferase [Leptothrix ochracea]|nr:uroporphyrinogen-III C-methyltransferase [Leptothrix ochracea]
MDGRFPMPSGAGISAAAQSAAAQVLTAGRSPVWAVAVLGVGLLVSGAALWSVWSLKEQFSTLEQELVRRQQTSADQAGEARVLARQAQDQTRDAAAKVSLLENRLAEVALQRTQVEELMQSLARSRDENLLTDVDAGLRVALQQTAITGSAEPLVAALRTADERLTRVNQPRLERVRRAIAGDLDRIRSAGVADLGALLIRLDEVVRLIDELPMLNQLDARPQAMGPSTNVAATVPAASTGGGSPLGWGQLFSEGQSLVHQVWNDMKGLIRVTRIDRPEAMLIAPDQAYFLRENLKLKVMNARLALLSHQSDVARADLMQVTQTLGRYFDLGSRRTQVVLESLKQVTTQSQQVGVPKPEATLAAIAAATAGH